MHINFIHYSSPMIDISKTGEVFLLDPELGRMMVYSTKGSMIRTFSFSLKGSSFIPMCFVVHGEKLLLAEENCVVLASPIDGLIFKYVLERYIVARNYPSLLDAYSMAGSRHQLLYVRTRPGVRFLFTIANRQR